MKRPDKSPPPQRPDADYASRLAKITAERVFSEYSGHPEVKQEGIVREDLSRELEEAAHEYLEDTRKATAILLDEAHNKQAAFFALETMNAEALVPAAREAMKRLIVERRAGIDELTGLPNRRIFNESLSRAISENERFGHHFSLIIFDLDHFKDVNDTYGHTAGDMVLVEMARRLSEDAKLREVDSLTRYGGEEFAAILPETPWEGAAILAERISEQINRRPFKIIDMGKQEHLINVTASIGIAQYSDAGKDPQGREIIREADSALYILKGGQADISGEQRDRRGMIACEGRVITSAEIAEHREVMQTPKYRTSMPPRRETTVPPARRILSIIPPEKD